MLDPINLELVRRIVLTVVAGGLVLAFLSWYVMLWLEDRAGKKRRRIG